MIRITHELAAFHDTGREEFDHVIGTVGIIRAPQFTRRPYDANEAPQEQKLSKDKEKTGL